MSTFLQFPPRCLCASVNSVVSRSPFFSASETNNLQPTTVDFCFLLALCFHILTNCFSRKPFPLIIIHIARGVVRRLSVHTSPPTSAAATLEAGAGEKLALRRRASSGPERVVPNALGCNDCRGNATTQVAIPEEPCRCRERRMVIYDFPMGMA